MAPRQVQVVPPPQEGVVNEADVLRQCLASQRRARQVYKGGISFASMLASVFVLLLLWPPTSLYPVRQASTDSLLGTQYCTLRAFYWSDALMSDMILLQARCNLEPGSEGRPLPCSMDYGDIGSGGLCCNIELWAKRDDLVPTVRYAWMHRLPGSETAQPRGFRAKVLG